MLGDRGNRKIGKSGNRAEARRGVIPLHGNLGNRKIGKSGNRAEARRGGGAPDREIGKSGNREIGQKRARRRRAGDLLLLLDTLCKL